MLLSTPLTKRLAITHPILLAPMDLVADAGLAAAVSRAGGLGILGGGYGEERWLARELGILANSQVQFGVGFITWSLAKQPSLLDLALESKPVAVMFSFGDPTPFLERSKRTGAAVICQVQTLSCPPVPQCYSCCAPSWSRNFCSHKSHMPWEMGRVAHSKPGASRHSPARCRTLPHQAQLTTTDPWDDAAVTASPRVASISSMGSTMAIA
jgi:hypothetical protein